MKGFALFELLIIMLMTILLYVFVQPSFDHVILSVSEESHELNYEL